MKSVARDVVKALVYAAIAIVSYSAGRSRGHDDGYAEGFKRGNETRRVQRSAYRSEAAYLEALREMNEERGVKAVEKNEDN